MSIRDKDRRKFLQSAFFMSLVAGTGSMPGFIQSASATQQPLSRRILVNTFLDGGPDFRHLIVPKFDDTEGSFGDKYWSNRGRAHSLGLSGQTAEQRYLEDYTEITVGSSAWSSAGLVDAGNLNAGISFGIWSEASWLIDMFMSGNVALVFNAVGGTNRAHDLSSLQLNQGNLLSTLSNQDRSGWGGRLARSVGGNSISLRSSPSPFSFGPVGAAPNYNPDQIDNSDLISVHNSREFGLFDWNPVGDPHGRRDDQIARAAKTYYAALASEDIGASFEKFTAHEATIREFGETVKQRLQSVPIPEEIEALYRDIDGINPGRNYNDTGDMAGRRILRHSDLGTQIRNLYDVIAVNDILNPAALSMSIRGWDTHDNQRQIPDRLADDPFSPYLGRGIENMLRDMFVGQYGTSPTDPTALDGAYSALWKNLPSEDKNKLVLTIAGEFGRQIRDNGGAGTDHGKGNLMLVISDRCRGGVYGEIFQQGEIPKYDEPPNNTPDIDPRTEIDELFGKVCDWVEPGSGSEVFPRTDPSYTGEPPLIELPGMFDNLMIDT